MLYIVYNSCQMFAKRMLIDYDVDNAQNVSGVIYHCSWADAFKNYDRKKWLEYQNRNLVLRKVFPFKSNPTISSL